jgi:NADH:ubiquinone oxidoreductase subunit 3 (subunit A)
MDANVAAILIFILVSVFTPVSFIITSKLLRRNTTRNAVKDSPFESAEESVGSQISVMHEYMHYFLIFLAYEILVAVVLVWSPIVRSLGRIQSAAILLLLFLGIVFSGFILLIARRNE